MATNNLLNEDDKKFLAEENEVWDEKFQEFQKKGFTERRNQVTFLAVKILEWNGKKPRDDDFENEINYLRKQIMR